MKGNDSLIQNKNAKKIGSYLAGVHNQPLALDPRSATFLNGQYLQEKSRALNMPYHEEIQKALSKMDCIMERIAGDISNPYANLWNRQDDGKNSGKFFYGNPAWDLGIVTNMLNDDRRVETFLRQYLKDQGTAVTIIELYTGILYAKLSDAMDNRYEEEWQRLAKNECVSVICNAGLAFNEIPAAVLARLGLPGLSRVL